MWYYRYLFRPELYIITLKFDHYCWLAKNMNRQNQSGIDISSIQYINSEKERDKKLEEALMDLYNLDPYEGTTKYYYNWVDLDGDGNDEVFVYLVGPIVCGTGGCSAVIFKKEGDKYNLLANFSLVNNPIIISNNKTKGYKDIIMNVYGGGIKPFWALMKYDGTTYPSNPSIEPPVKPGTKLEGIAIIADDLHENPGIKIQLN